MSKLDTLKQRFWSPTAPKDFSWKELQKILISYGYTEKQGGGSRVKFIDKTGNLPRIQIHKPHPDPILPRHILKYLRKTLTTAGITS